MLLPTCSAPRLAPPPVIPPHQSAKEVKISPGGYVNMLVWKCRVPLQGICTPYTAMHPYRLCSCWDSLDITFILHPTTYLDVMMKILLITLFLFPETILGGHRVVCPTLIEAVEGDAVTLRGHLSPPVNLTPYTLDLKRLDLYNTFVHVYRHEQDHVPAQSRRYRGRTTLIHEDLIGGTVTLQISSVNLSDSGPYEVYVPDLRASCVFDLTVERKANRTKRTDSSTSGPPVEEETESEHRDGENRKTVRAVILPTVLLLWILLVLVLVLMRGKITKGDEDLERAAGNLV